jgi:hypothetical protein
MRETFGAPHEARMRFERIDLEGWKGIAVWYMTEVIASSAVRWRVWAQK